MQGRPVSLKFFCKLLLPFSDTGGHCQSCGLSPVVGSSFAVVAICAVISRLLVPQIDQPFQVPFDAVVYAYRSTIQGSRGSLFPTFFETATSAKG